MGRGYLPHMAASPAQPAESETASRRSRSRGLSVLLLIVALVLLVVVAFWALLFFTSETETVEETFDSGDIQRLVVDGEGGGIDLTVVERADIEVASVRTSNVLADAETRIDVADGTLTVTSGCDPLLLAFNCSVSHNIEVPVNSVTELELATTAGDVDVAGHAGDVVLSTTAGDISLVEFSGTTAELETTAGSITVRATAPPDTLSAETTAGDVEIVVPDEVYRVGTDTTAGGAEVLVRQDPDSDLVIDASTTAGDISIANPDD